MDHEESYIRNLFECIPGVTPFTDYNRPKKLLSFRHESSTYFSTKIKDDSLIINWGNNLETYSKMISQIISVLGKPTAIDGSVYSWPYHDPTKVKLPKEPSIVKQTLEKSKQISLEEIMASSNMNPDVASDLDKKFEAQTAVSKKVPMYHPAIKRVSVPVVVERSTNYDPGGSKANVILPLPQKVYAKHELPKAANVAAYLSKIIRFDNTLTILNYDEEYQALKLNDLFRNPSTYRFGINNSWGIVSFSRLKPGMAKPTDEFIRNIAWGLGSSEHDWVKEQGIYFWKVKNLVETILVETASIMNFQKKIN